MCRCCNHDDCIAHDDVHRAATLRARCWIWHAGTTYTLAKYLRAFGVEAAAFTEDGWLDIGYGFGRGFARYWEDKSPNIMEPQGRVGRIFGRASQWLRANHGKRFFLFLHTYQVHAPYVPPEKYLKTLRQAGSYADRPAGSGGLGAAFDDMVRYDAEIRYTDDELRRFWQTLDELGLAENTVFILTSDHGEEFLEHGHLQHGADNYEEAVHVPLMMIGPGLPPGRRIPGNVSLADVMPTVLELMGVPVPGGIAGTSLLARIRAKDTVPRSRAVYSESLAPFALGPNQTTLPFLRPAYSVQLGSRKLHRYRQAEGYRYEYYDLTRDPGERTNAYDPDSPQVAQLAKLLGAYEQRCREAQSTKAPGLEPGGRTNEAKGVPIDPIREEKLRALGYLR